MHILFVHQNYPAQFGHIAHHLVEKIGFRCTFLSRRQPTGTSKVERIQYQLRGGATPQTHYCSRTFENAIWHSDAVYRALRTRRELKPDLVVAHSGFLSTVFLRELYSCPIINYFEYFYRMHGSDMDFRADFPSSEANRLRARARNAVLLLDLENCDAGYSPTIWQRDRLPRIFYEKIRVIFDGIDTAFWRSRSGLPRRIGKRDIPPDIMIVTYVARGMESMRGFDIFMKIANRLCQRRTDALFVVVGQDRVCYGGDSQVTGQQSFKQWVLAQERYDLSRFVFTGLIRPEALARLLAITDLHIYLTVPFVLSWSLFNALACGATVLASRTAPVLELIEDGKNGLLADFFDIDGFVDLASKVLDNPKDFRHLGAAGMQLIQEKYSLDVIFPRLVAFYEEIAGCAADRHGALP